jgi:ABC-type transport system involved in cytochrome bd biosynthesis fused ATPase/permease subunit
MAMTKEKFLTLRWNNILTLGFGLIMLTYVGFVISASALSDVSAFIGLVLIGAVY